MNVAVKKRKLKRGHQQHIREEDLLEFLKKNHQELDRRKIESHIRLMIEDALARDSVEVDA